MRRFRSLLGPKLTFRSTFFGFFICGIVVALTGRIAATYHVSFPVITRTSFGMYGCIPMQAFPLPLRPPQADSPIPRRILIRSTVALLWTAISIVQAGGFFQCMVEAMAPRYKNWNTLPESANITHAPSRCSFPSPS